MKQHTLLVLTALLFATVPVVAQSTGSLEGRVSSAGSSRGLENARVSVQPSGDSTLTNAAGQFRFEKISPGDVTLSITYFGMQRYVRTIKVAATETTKVVAELQRTDSGNKGDEEQVIKLGQFNVVEEREMNAQAVAFNEQRVAVNSSRIVSLDQFGNQNLESLGEFLHFLPGVGAVVQGDGGAVQATLRGFPSSYSNIFIDGGIAANARGTSRAVYLADVGFLNASRVEVTKVSTPDLPASGLGGAINVISKTGFELSRPEFRYRLSETTHSSNGGNRLKGVANLRWPEHLIDATSPGYSIPSFDLSYRGPISDRLSVTAAIGQSWRLKPVENNTDTVDVETGWNRVSLVQTNGVWQGVSQRYYTYGGQLGFDFKISPQDTLSVGLELKSYSFDLARSRFAVDYGAGATGGQNFTQGAAAGVGTLTIGGGNGWYRNSNEQRQFSARYRHDGDTWKMELNADYSDARFRQLSAPEGYFFNATAQIDNLVIRGDDIPLWGIASRYSVRDRSGQPIDLTNYDNYSIVSAVDNFRDNLSEVAGLRGSATRDFEAVVPVKVKVGFAASRDRRDLRASRSNYSFRPNGATDVASRRAGLFDVFDMEYQRAVNPNAFGIPVRDLSNRKVYDLFRKNPSWFVLDEPAQHQSRVTGSAALQEDISAAYLRGDTRLMSQRLWLTAGVRFERTEIEGRGPRNDVSATYARSANGSIVRDASGKPVLITTDPLALRKLQFVERGAAASSSYDGFYPSLNASYRVGESFVARFGYARTIGRPDLPLIIPGTTISEPDVSSPTITVNNPGLRPWTASSYDISLETYEIRGGSGTVSVFQKDVSGFFNTVRTPATDSALADLGLPTNGTYIGYQILNQSNGGDARITGIEFGYSQNLLFLPGVLRSLQVYANYTKLRTQGQRSADFSGFIPESISAGVNFVRPRYFVKFTFLNQAEFNLNSVAASSSELPDTYEIQPVYRRYGLNAEYSFSRRFALFFSTQDLNRRRAPLLRAAPSTPEYAKIRRNIILGTYVTLGVKGTF